MDYQFALELKQAGFPQKGYSPFSVCVHTETHPNGHTCGDKFLLLQLNHDVKKLGRWEAGSYWRQRTLQAFGETPEEAVARLWLQLQHTSASQPIFS